MLKTVTSFFITNVAIAVITLSLVAWMIDGTILQPKVLLPALQKNGTPAAIAKAIPEIVQNNVSPADAAAIKEKISTVITEQYVNQKLTAIVTNFATFIKTGEPEPSLDLSDLPAKLSAAGAPVPDELAAKLAAPVTFTDKNAANVFTNIRKSYQLLQIFKIIGPIVAIMLLAIDWLLADRGHKTVRLGNIFASLSFWSGLYWFGITKLPAIMSDKIAQKAGASNEAVSNIAISIIHGVADLFTAYLRNFTILSIALAVIFYGLHFALRRFKPKPAPKAYTAPAAK